MAFLLTNFGTAQLEAPLASDALVLYIAPEASENLPEPSGGDLFALTIWDGTDEEIVYASANPLSGAITITRGEEGTTARSWLAGTQVRHSLTAETVGNILQTGFVAGNMATEAEAEAGVLDDKLMSPAKTSAFWDARVTAFSAQVLTSETDVEMRRYLGWDSAVFSGTGLQTSFTLPDTDWDTPYTKVYLDEIFQTSGYTITGDQLEFDVPPPNGVDNIVVVLGVNFAFSVSFPGNNTVDTPALVDEAVETAKIADGAVTTPKLADNAVTYAKMQQVSAVNKVLGRGNGGVGNVEEMDFTAYTQTLAALTTQGAWQTALTSIGWPIPTAMVGLFLTTTVPTGWVKLNGTTIGSASSGATGRANADTEPLYTALWNSTSNTTLVIQTSAGAPTTRGASAAADFAANKRLPLPDLRGEFPRGWDDGRGVDGSRAFASAQTDLVKAHTHTLTMDAVAAHTHAQQQDGSRHGANDDNPGSNFYTSNGDTSGSQGTPAKNTAAGGGHTPTGNANANTGTENRPRNVALAFYAKL